MVARPTHDAWGRPWGHAEFGAHPEVGIMEIPGIGRIDYWGRAVAHPEFGLVPGGANGLGDPYSAAEDYGHASEVNAGLPMPAQTGQRTIPSMVSPDQRQAGANPGLPQVFEPAARAHARIPSWNPAGLDATQAPYRAREKMAPASHYYQGPNVVVFDAPGVPAIVGQATISGPLLDMRPDLRNVGMGNRQETSVPIWREAAFGQGVYQFIRFYYLIPTISVGLKVFSTQFGDPGREDLVSQLQMPEEITAEFFDGFEGVSFSFPTPLFRFWRVQIRFDQLDGVRGTIGPLPFMQYAIAVY